MLLKKALTTAALLGSLFAASSVFAHAHLKRPDPGRRQHRERAVGTAPGVFRRR